MGMDLFIPARRDAGDETLAEFVRRRLGNECLDKIAEPLMSGIYNAEADKQSILATFPRFRELEEQHGSLTRGMLASMRARKSSPAPTHPGSKPLSAFVSLSGGIEELVTTLVPQLTGSLRLATGVLAVEPVGGCTRLHLSDGSVLVAGAVVFATPAFVTADLVRGSVPRRGATFGRHSLREHRDHLLGLPGG